MEIIRDSTENEMILCFLAGELNSHRFSAELSENMKKLGISEDTIRSGDLLSEEQNSLRRKLLGEFRGYPDNEIFENYPKDITWKYVRFSESDIGSLYYVDYSYWNELSRGTSRPADAVLTIKSGTEIFGQPNDNFLRGAEYLKTGKFPPIIVLTCGNGKYLILEGHCRATSYALSPGRFGGTFGYCGFCTEPEMKAKNAILVRS